MCLFSCLLASTGKVSVLEQAFTALTVHTHKVTRTPSRLTSSSSLQTGACAVGTESLSTVSLLHASARPAPAGSAELNHSCQLRCSAAQLQQLLLPARAPSHPTPSRSTQAAAHFLAAGAGCWPVDSTPYSSSCKASAEQGKMPCCHDVRALASHSCTLRAQHSQSVLGAQDCHRHVSSCCLGDLATCHAAPAHPHSVQLGASLTHTKLYDRPAMRLHTRKDAP